MGQKKISDLTVLAVMSSANLLHIQDGVIDKQLTASLMADYVLKISGQGEIDGTLAANSDLYIPTQKAVRDAIYRGVPVYNALDKTTWIGKVVHNGENIVTELDGLVADTVYIEPGTYVYGQDLDLTGIKHLRGAGITTILQPSGDWEITVGNGAGIGDGHIFEHFKIDAQNIASGGQDIFNGGNGAIGDKVQCKNITITGDVGKLGRGFSYIWGGLIGCGVSLVYDGFYYCNNISSCQSYNNGDIGFRNCNNISNCSTTLNPYAGFFECHNISACDSDTDYIGFRNSEKISGSAAQNATANGFGTSIKISACQSNNNNASGFSLSTKISACEANGNGTHGFDECDNVSACEANSNSNVGFIACDYVSASYATNNTAYGFLTCNYVSASYSINNGGAPADNWSGGSFIDNLATKYSCNS